VELAATSRRGRPEHRAIRRRRHCPANDRWLARPRLARFIDPELRDKVLSLLDVSGVPFAPAERVTDCRDPKDDKYLELALAASADRIVTGDDDLLVLHPWRGVRILGPADYLAEAGPGVS
jgi:predicted nucleic acid-binding protein